MERESEQSGTLAGRYVIQQELGRGGMAVVYLARDVKYGRHVAVKVLRRELSIGVGTRRFLREVDLIAHLQHPNILPVYDSGEQAGNLFYVMPYVKGESLRQLLNRERQLPIEQALSIIREVADALEYAHGRDIVHRDIKPENILLSEGHAVIADFGIARALSSAVGDRVTESGHAVGTPAYMSPEQASGETELDNRADLYSLGCVLYEMLAGEPPFTGPTAQAIIARHMFERPPSINVVRPAVPAEIVATIGKSLEKSPADRFPTASAFLEALCTPVTRSVRRSVFLSPGYWLISAALVLISALAVLTLRQLMSSGDEALDPNKVVIFPMHEIGVQAEEARAGLVAEIAIGAALEHTYPLKSISARDRLEASVRGRPDLITAAMASDVARDREAKHYIKGAVTIDNDSIRIQLGLHDVAGDSLVSQETESGALTRASVEGLAFAVVRALLPKLIAPQREVDLSALEDRHPGAIALWILGEIEYGEAHFKAAKEFYRRALDEDSLLVFAAIKAAQASSWQNHSAEAQGFIDIAVAHDSLLPVRYRYLAHGFDAYLAGRADQAVQFLEDALEVDPEWSEAAMTLGEVYHHLLPSQSRPDSLARHWIRRARDLDPTFTPPLMHLAEMSIRDGMLDSADVFSRRLSIVGSDAVAYRHLELMIACARDGPSAIDWGAEVRRDAFRVLIASKEISVGAVHRECAKSGFAAIARSDDAVRAHRWAALLALQGLLIAEGRDHEASLLLDSLGTSLSSLTNAVYIVDVAAGGELTAQASRVEAYASERFGLDYRDASVRTRWIMGVWHALHKQADKVNAICESSVVSARESGSRRDSLLAMALRGHVAFARGDTAEAISRFGQLVSDAPRDQLVWRLDEPLAVERILLAQLLLGARNYEDAYRVASIFDHPAPIVFLPYVPLSLAVRIRAAEALNWRDRVRSLRGRLIHLGRTDLLGESLISTTNGR